MILDIILLLCLLSGTFLIYFYAIQGKIKSGLFIVLILGGLFRVFMASDPVLHKWDERYHALVAKNLTKHPLTPTLYDDPILPTSELDWSSSHIWLSKPPVPLWIMASSIAVFGDTILAIRLPSIILSLLAVYLTFLIGKRLFHERVGLIAAFLHAINGLVIEVATGRVSSDHVESCFILCVELAIYFVLQSYDKKKALRYIALAGIFTGLAFLSKWFPAFIVFPVWFIGFIFKGSFSWNQFIIQGAILLGAFTLVVLPWIFQLQDLEDNILERVLFAFSEPVAEHQHPGYYYFHQIMIIFGELVYVPIGLIVYQILKGKQQKVNWMLLMWILLPLIIFTIGETKRYTYMLIAAPAFFVLIANGIDFFTEKYLKGTYRWYSAIFISALLLLPVRYSIERMKLFQAKQEVPEFYFHLKEYGSTLTDNDVVFGVEENIELMFFTDVAAAYPYYPSNFQYDLAMNKGYTIYYFYEGKLVEASLLLQRPDEN